jgi:uncharacterized protein (TIGR00369 family)
MLAIPLSTISIRFEAISMNSEDPKLGAEAFAREILARPPLHQWLDIRLDAFDEENGTLTVHLPHRPELRRSPDQRDFHGGIIATLVDLAGHACVAAKVGRRVPTVDMRVDYLRPAVDTDLRAVARILRVGRTVGICDVQVLDSADRVIATGRCVYSTHKP